MAAAVWGLQEPADQRLFHCDYSDIAVLGKALTRGPRWYAIGLGIHVLNGAIFGFVFGRVRRLSVWIRGNWRSAWPSPNT
jgi:hypothetical protein